MEKQEIQIAKNGVKYYRDWDCEGAICVVNPKTIQLYKELKSPNVNPEDYDVFFAFSEEQFKKGMKSIRPLKDGEKIVTLGAGIYGTCDGLDAYLKALGGNDDRIREECDPQEVYFYEWNNHECMFGDEKSAFDIVVGYFGEDVASTITRLYY